MVIIIYISKLVLQDAMQKLRKQEKSMTAELEDNKFKIATLEANLQQSSDNIATQSAVSDDIKTAVEDHNLENDEDISDDIDDDNEQLEESGIFDVTSMEHSMTNTDHHDNNATNKVNNSDSQ